MLQQSPRPAVVNFLSILPASHTPPGSGAPAAGTATGWGGGVPSHQRQQPPPRPSGGIMEPPMAAYGYSSGGRGGEGSGVGRGGGSGSFDENPFAAPPSTGMLAPPSAPGSVAPALVPNPFVQVQAQASGGFYAPQPPPFSTASMTVPPPAPAPAGGPYGGLYGGSLVPPPSLYASQQQQTQTPFQQQHSQQHFQQNSAVAPPAPTLGRASDIGSEGAFF